MDAPKLKPVSATTRNPESPPLPKMRDSAYPTDPSEAAPKAPVDPAAGEKPR